MNDRHKSLEGSINTEFASFVGKKLTSDIVHRYTGALFLFHFLFNKFSILVIILFPFSFHFYNLFICRASLNCSTCNLWGLN